MTDDALQIETRDICVDEVFPHARAILWRTVTQPDLMARWLPMPSKDFEAIVGHRFTFQTKAAGEWDGTIQCEVLEVVPEERLSYSWCGGHESNGDGYGSRLNTILTITLEDVEGGTRLRLVHSGFILPRNQTAFGGMGGGWSGVVAQIGKVAAEAAA